MRRHFSPVKQNNITQSVRSKDGVDYVALNNLFSADFETALKGKRIYKRGAYSGTFTGDQIINKSDVVGSINFRIALVSFPTPSF